MTRAGPIPEGFALSGHNDWFGDGPIRTGKVSFWKFYWNALQSDALFSLDLKLGGCKPEAVGRHLATVQVKPCQKMRII